MLRNTLRHYYRGRRRLFAKRIDHAFDFLFSFAWLPLQPSTCKTVKFGLLTGKKVAKAYADIYKNINPKPANTMVGTTALVDPAYLVEIQVDVVLDGQAKL